jgi:succinoglycan biosynthesis transport protein ExoP
MKDLIPASPSDSGLQLLSPMDGGQAPPPTPPKFRLQKLLFFLRKFWWVPVSSVAVCCAGAVAIFLLSPPAFVTTGRLWETEKLQVPGGAAFTVDRDNYLGTQAELLRSLMLRQLTLNWMRANNPGNISLGENGEPLPVEIVVFASPKSSVYTIEARSANPAFTPIYLNALMKQYLEYRRNVRKEVSSDTLASISEQVQKLERELKLGQTALEEYERSNNFAVLQEESTVEASYLAKLKTELSDLQLQLKLLNDTAQSLAVLQPGATNSADSMLENLRATDPSSSAGRLDAARQIELLKVERARLSKRLRPEHPKIVKLDEDIARSQKLLDVFSRQNQEQINALRDTLQLKITNVLAFIKQWEAKVSDSSARLAAANGLKTGIARNQSMYDRLVSMLQNVDISRNIDQETLAILEPADSAKRSYKEAQMMLVQAGFIGLLLGCAIIFVIALRDDRFNSMVEVTESFGDNVVGQVPEMPELAAPGSSPLALLQSNDDRHMFAESYRNLRSALLYLAVDGKRPRVLLVTSAVPNEGKSTVATNLARAMSLGGSKVLLVDADLRKGHIHEKLALKSKPGLSELLRQSAPAGQLADWRDFLQKTDLENFLFLSRGAVCHSPGDLFLNPVFDQFLEQVRTKFDYVIIDSSPVFAADDSSTLAPKVEGTLFVVRNQFSNARAVREALNLLFQRQARVLGLILNRADSADRSYYAYKYADYYAKSNVEADEKD